MNILLLYGVHCIRMQSAAKEKGHRVRCQVAGDGPLETRSKVRWADMVVAEGALAENAVGALYLAFDTKKTVRVLGELVPLWARRYGWRTQSEEEWLKSLPMLPEQKELFT